MPSMDPRNTADHGPSPEAIEFVRFCYRRRRVGWPELYDEMCAVAGRGLFRGWGTDELASQGIAFSLFDLPALAAVVSRVIMEEQPQRLVRARAEAESTPPAGAREDEPAGDRDGRGSGLGPGRLTYAGVQGA
jgi:hypothetical protein